MRLGQLMRASLSHVVNSLQQQQPGRRRSAPPLIVHQLQHSAAEYCDERVCLSVCVCCLSVRDHIFGTTRPIFANFLCMLSMAMARSTSDTSCISGFIDDVVFAHKPRLFDVAAQLKRSAHAALGLAINCAQ